MPEEFSNQTDQLGNLKIIDSHLHAGRWGQQTICGQLIEPFKGRDFGLFTNIKNYITKHKIDRVVLVPIYSPDPSTAFKMNPTVLKYAVEAPSQIVPAFWIDPSPGVRHLLTEAIHLAEQNDIRVFKTSPSAWSGEYSSDPFTWDQSFKIGIELILEFLKQKRGLLQIHTGNGKSDVTLIEKFIRYIGPGITLHLVHMGYSVQGHFYLLPRVQQWISEGLDIICDTSLTHGFALRWAFSEAQSKPELARRILFGSDEPWGIFESELSKVVHAAGGDCQIIQKVLWENADRMYPIWSGTRY